MAETETKSGIGRRIIDARLSIGEPQGVFARRIGRTQPALSMWESEKETVGIASLKIIAKATRPKGTTWQEHLKWLRFGDQEVTND